MRLTILSLLVTLIAVHDSAAQVIEFEPPVQIEVDTSRLIVTFQDTVDIERARRVVEEVGATITSEHPGHVVAWALFFTIPEIDPVLALRSDERVETAELLPPSASHGIWVELEDGSRAVGDFTTHALRASFATSRDAAEVETIVHTYLPDVALRVERLPNELVVELPDEGEVAAEQLEANPLVQYVTYFSLDDPLIDE